MENQAAILYGVKDVRVEKWPVPELSEFDVLVKMASVGICGSDVKIYSTGVCGADVCGEPIVIGHEGAGVVVQVGSKVMSLKAGDRVAIEPTQPCLMCEYCKQGRYNICVEPQYCSSKGAHGNLCRYYKHRADFCHKVPENVSLDEAAAVQPLAIAIHACNRAQIRLGNTLVIMGAGPIGLLCAMTARASGASKILITDVVESRLDIAKKYVDYTLLIRKGVKEEEVVEEIIKLLGSRPDISMDATGNPFGQRLAMMVAKSGGLAMLVGVGPAKTEVPLTDTVLREVDVKGSYRIANTYPTALAAVSSGAIDLKSFITHHYPMEDINEALALAGSGAAMKIIMHP